MEPREERVPRKAAARAQAATGGAGIVGPRCNVTWLGAGVPMMSPGLW